MSITVEVMYSDLSIKKYSPEDFLKSQKNHILFILFKEDGKNLFSLNGLDYYGVKIEETQIHFVQYNEEDGTIFTYNKKEKKCCKGNTIARDKWVPKDFVVFVGVEVSNENWKKAINKFDREMSSNGSN